MTRERAAADVEAGHVVTGECDTGTGPRQVVSLVLPAPARVGLVAGGVVGVLALLGAVAAFTRATGATFAGSEGLVALFHLDSEFNVPAIVSVLGLAACGGLLLLVGACLRATDHRDARRWHWLGVGFLYLALDEGARIHERANAVVNQWGIPLDILRFGWVVLGAAAVIALVPVYLPAVLRLPGDLRWLAIVSAVLFVGGAIGMEMVGATLYERGVDDAGYQTAVLVEESAEMAGVALFLTTLWAWWRRVTARTLLVHAGASTGGDASVADPV